MATEDQIRSLTRREIQVLYWRCKGDLNKEIALRYQKDIKAVEASMTSVYQKLGVDKKVNKVDRLTYLTNEICPIVMRLIGENADNLEKWPLYGVRAAVQNRGVTVYAEKEVDDSPRDPDPIVRDLMLIDQGEVVDEPPISSPSPVLPGQNKTSPPGRNWAGFAVLGALGLFCLCFGIVAWFAGDSIIGWFNPPTSPISQIESTPTSSITPTEIIITNTSSPTRLPTDTPESTLTYTPEIPPTAVPLPIVEHFNDPISSVWTVTGDPIQTATKDNAPLGFDGVLTTVPGQYASIATGNTAWSNYIIHLRAEGLASNGDFFLGFRVKDLNNMIAIDCVALNCNWVVIENGNKEIISSLPGFYAGYEFTLTVQDENFKGTQIMPMNWDTLHPFLILPPKYKGKFLNGGVYLRFKDMEIDYIEILAP